VGVAMDVDAINIDVATIVVTMALYEEKIDETKEVVVGKIGVG
jgi:hypothetical protein